jgi:hypothetical protein
VKLGLSRQTRAVWMHCNILLCSSSKIGHK